MVCVWCRRPVAAPSNCLLWVRGVGGGIERRDRFKDKDGEDGDGDKEAAAAAEKDKKPMLKFSLQSLQPVILSELNRALIMRVLEQVCIAWVILCYG